MVSVSVNLLIKRALFGDKQVQELDALIEKGAGSLMRIDIKSGVMVASDFFNGLDCWRERFGAVTQDPWLIYGGSSRQRRERGHVVPWNDMDALLNQMV